MFKYFDFITIFPQVFATETGKMKQFCKHVIRKTSYFDSLDFFQNFSNKLL